MHIALALGLILVAAAMGATLYRFRGGGFGNNGPRPIAQILFDLFPSIIMPAFPFWVLYRLTQYDHAVALNPVILSFWIGFYILAVLWSVAWECSGHGGFQDLGHSTIDPPKRGLEVIEHLIYPWAYKILPRYWYDAFGLMLTGMVVTLSSGLFVMFCGNLIAGAALAASGGLKVIGYMIGWKWFKGAQTGEWISGGLRWAAAAAIFWFLY